MELKGKKGFLRILEVFIAIMLIASVMSFIYIKQIQKPNKEQAIHQIQKIALGEINSDNLLREAVLTENTAKINETLSSIIPRNYGFKFQICKLDDICGLERQDSYYTDNEIYADETVISSTLETYSPKKIRLFIWEK